MSSWFLIGDGESTLSERQFNVIEAENADQALATYIAEVAIRDDHFIEHIYTRGVNRGFGKKFYLVTPEDNEKFWTTGEPPISKEVFSERVREFFGDKESFADLYLQYYFLDPTRARTTVMFPDDMMIFIFEHLRKHEDWMALEVIPMDEVVLG